MSEPGKKKIRWSAALAEAKELVWSQRRRLFGALFLMLVGRLAGLVLPASSKILIDDVFGELDPGRRNALMAAWPADSQKLITTTHLDWLDGRFADARVQTVRDGRVCSPEARASE